MSTNDGEQDLFGFKRMDELVYKVAPTRPSRIQQRLIESSVAIEEGDPHSLVFQHTVFCQTGMPYRDPGASVCEWEREQGRVALKISTGEARDPKTNRWLKLGIPFGPKPRLILAYLNGEALRSGSPVIEVEDTALQPLSNASAFRSRA